MVNDLGVQFGQMLDIIIVHGVDPRRFVGLAGVTFGGQAHVAIAIADVTGRACEGVRTPCLALLEAGQFFVQVQVVQVHLADLPGVIVFGRLACL